MVFIVFLLCVLWCLVSNNNCLVWIRIILNIIRRKRIFDKLISKIFRSFDSIFCMYRKIELNRKGSNGFVFRILFTLFLLLFWFVILIFNFLWLLTFSICIIFWLDDFQSIIQISYSIFYLRKNIILVFQVSSLIFIVSQI